MKSAKMVVLALVLAAVSVSGSFAGDTPDQAYFDQKFAELQRNVAGIKGDTTQIVSILGHVFEGTVPRGGTVSALCEKNGWQLVVLMGHNNIKNPDEVAAGAKFTYPRTNAELQAALRRGNPLYKAWLKTRETTFRVNRIKADTAEIDKLNVRVAHFTEKLKIKEMEVDTLKVRLAEITERLRIKQAEIEELSIDRANINKLNVNQAHIHQMTIDKLRIKQLEIDNLKDLLAQAQGRISQLEARPTEVKVRYIEGSGTSGCGKAKCECDEDAFYGDVPDIVMEKYGEVDAFELHYRADKPKRIAYKAKRGHVKLDENGEPKFYPMTFADGSCMRKYASSEVRVIEKAQKLLLFPGEKMVKIDGFNELGGCYNTIAVYVIVK